MSADPSSAGAVGAPARAVLTALAAGWIVRRLPGGNGGAKSRLYGLYRTSNPLAVPERTVSEKTITALLAEQLVSRDGAVIRLVDSHTQGTGADSATAYRLPESPLAWLAKRRMSNGQPLLAPEQLEAGTRLHADFICGGLQGRVTMRWDANPGSGRRKAGGRRPAEAGDAAHAARQRFRRAVQAVGPELAGVVIDVCCFEIGLADVEGQNGWPRRSGKLVLQMALTRLARHYGLIEQASAYAETRHWGAEGFRPRLE